jgi:hypothetical protein
MNTKKIQIAGKEVNLAYCFATEVNFKLLADSEINDFIVEVAEAITTTPQRLPDIRKSIFLIISSAQSYYNAQGEEMKIIDKDLLFKAKPIELGTAIGTILALRNEFYTIPDGEPKNKQGKGKGKNS